MRNNDLVRFFVGILFCYISGPGFSQSIKASKIHYRTIDNTIEIFYSLPACQDSVEVKLAFYKKSDKKFKYYPKFIKGAVGIGKFSGVNKKITWYFKKEPASLFTGAGFYFKVIVSKIKKSEYSY